MSWFPDNFEQSLARFNELASMHKMQRLSLPIQGMGPGGRELSIEIAFNPAKNARKSLVHIIGVHGVEGYPGSAIQSSILQNRSSWSEDVAVFFVHPFNPYGMSWIRRVNGNNVDLNRNFIDAENLPPPNVDYAYWSRFLNPKSLVDSYLSVPYGVRAYFSLGHDRSLQAIAQGQYLHDESLFFGGKTIQQELKVFNEWILGELNKYEVVWMLDVHSGLGEYAKEILFVDAMETRENADLYATLFDHKITRPKTGDGIYSSHGALSEMLRQSVGSRRLRYVLQEFGTFNEFKIGWNMRREKVVHEEKDDVIEHPVKRRFLEVFCPSDPKWRRAVVEQGRRRFEQIYAELNKKSPH